MKKKLNKKRSATTDSRSVGYGREKERHRRDTANAAAVAAVDTFDPVSGGRSSIR